MPRFPSPSPPDPDLEEFYDPANVKAVTFSNGRAYDVKRGTFNEFEKKVPIFDEATGRVKAYRTVEVFSFIDDGDGRRIVGKSDSIVTMELDESELES